MNAYFSPDVLWLSAVRVWRRLMNAFRVWPGSYCGLSAVFVWRRLRVHSPFGPGHVSKRCASLAKVEDATSGLVRTILRVSAMRSPGLTRSVLWLQCCLRLEKAEDAHSVWPGPC